VPEAGADDAAAAAATPVGPSTVEHFEVSDPVETDPESDDGKRFL
jgi:hypothetical protein